MELDDYVFRTSLEKAARRGKIKINASEIVTVLRTDSTLFMAPIRELDVIPISELPKGVNGSFDYIDRPARNILPTLDNLVSVFGDQIGKLAHTVRSELAQGGRRSPVPGPHEYCGKPQQHKAPVTTAG